MTLDYAIVTPARDEEANLRRLAKSICDQTITPRVWIIVDNGSSDRTQAVAEDLAFRHGWIDCTSAPAADSAQPGAPIVRAFHWGLRRLCEWPDVVVKVDADVSMPPDYFELLLGAFQREPRLGLAGGRCLEEMNGEWQPVQVTGAHVRGATRAYRAECLRGLLPLPEQVGWDTVDEMQAVVNGWQTRTVDEARFCHHRAVGARDGTRAARWRAKGRAAHYLGYRPNYLVLRALFNARFDLAALAMVTGYFGSAVLQRPQHPDSEARAHLRRQQRLRNLPAVLSDHFAGRG